MDKSDKSFIGSEFESMNHLHHNQDLFLSCSLDHCLNQWIILVITKIGSSLIESVTPNQDWLLFLFSESAFNLVNHFIKPFRRVRLWINESFGYDWDVNLSSTEQLHLCWTLTLELMSTDQDLFLFCLNQQMFFFSHCWFSRSAECSVNIC